MLRSWSTRPTLAFAALAVVALALAPTPGDAQQRRPKPRRAELHGKDFRPDGGWRRRAGEVRSARTALLRSRQLDRLNGARLASRVIPAVSGTLNMPVILVRPSGAPAGHSPSGYQSLLFGTTPPPGKPYTLRTYYTELSGGLLEIEGQVLGWYDAPRTNTYYEDGCNGVGVFGPCPNNGLRFGELLVHGLQAADAAGVNWARFDNDGADGTPNSGDDDGFVDVVAFIHPDVDGACGTRHIWAHRAVISAFAPNGQPFTTSTRARNGGFIKVQDYTVQSGVGGGTTSCDARFIMPIGIMAHETGHVFGLPDLYDTSGQGAGIGYWGLMGAGNYASPDSPARMEAWSLFQLGWIDLLALPAGNRTIPPIATARTAWLLPVPNRNEYFLLENRQPLLADTALLNPAYGVGRGLLVWHVDDDLLQARLARNNVNTPPVRAVELVQADGRYDLQQAFGTNLADAGDPFPGAYGNERFSAATNPSALDNAGEFAGFRLDRIAQLDGFDMHLRLTRRPRSVVTTSVGTIPIRTNEVPETTRLDDIFIPGEAFTLSAPAFDRSVNDSRVGFEFSRWTGWTPQGDQFTPSSGKPDMVVAWYTTVYRIAFRASGTGTVTTAPARLDPADQQLYTASGITLTATPSGGAEFAGWSGDTTAADPVLALPGGKPYDVVANFRVSPAVLSFVAAARALLGGPPLDPAVAQSLDRDGNRTGGYDLGDLLAYLDRHQGTLSPALLERLFGQAAETISPAAAGPAGEER